MTTSSSDFAKFMLSLTTAIPRYAPNPNDVNVARIWYKELGHFSLDELQAIYAKAIATFDAFPSIRELMALGGRSIKTPEEIGREVAERIWSGMSRFHSVNGPGQIERVNEYLGPVGAHVVKMAGGWNFLCESATIENMTTLKAQWRNYAMTVSEYGHLEAGPDWSQLTSGSEFKALIAKLDVAPKENAR